MKAKHFHIVCRFTLLTAVLLSVTLASADPPMTAHFIDVGQGDATLLEFPCGAVLIDAGAREMLSHVARGEG